ncbi:MAG: SPOR domain-containing protein [Bacteroidales bacterium]
MTIGEIIKQLLEERKRVILPGFGNLEVKESGGAVSSSSKRIDPPGLNIKFDSSFSKDDGLLANAFAEGGGVDREEAEQQVLELVDAIRFALDRGEPYALNDAGIFRRDDEGKIRFQPNPAWLLEPDQYGLGSMELLELEDLPAEKEESFSISVPELSEEKVVKPEEKPEEKIPGGKPVEKTEWKPVEKTERKPAEKPDRKPVAKLVPPKASKSASKPEKGDRRSGLWRVIWITTGILIVLLVVLLLIPADKSRLSRKKDHQQPVQSESPAIKPGVTEQTAPVSEPVKPVVKEVDPEPLPVTEPPDHFFIIAGSFKNLANASELQDKLKARGLQAEVMITENRMYRVSVASYPSSEEAERNLPRFKSQPGLESCWLLSNE